MIIRVRVDGQVYDVDVVDVTARPVIARIGGETFEVTPEEAGAPVMPGGVAAPEGALPVATVNGGGVQGDSATVIAPIPGTIIAVSVQPGDRVEHGQELCVLEAMKMKNAIRATRAGTVSKVHVAVGSQVRQGQPLVSYSD